MYCGRCALILTQVLNNFLFSMDPLTNGGGLRSEFQVPPIGEDMAVFRLAWVC